MFDIISENKDFIVISKHPNVDVHQGETHSLIDEIRKQIHFDTLHMCHRLDKKTSGLMIFAKSQAVASTIQTMFEERKIDRYYIGVSDRKAKKKNGTIKGDLLKSRNGNYKLAKTLINPSITAFKSMSFNNLRYFLIKPISGKTHQIRVVLKSLSAPIIGDDRYGGSQNDIMLLHAYQLKFVWEQQEISFCNLPNYSTFISEEDLKDIIEQLETKV